MKWLTIRRLVYVLVGLAAVIFAMGALPDLLGLPEWIPPVQKLVDDLYGNFFTEALSIAVTIGVIDLLNQRRLEEQRRQELIDQLSSRVPGFPAEAVRLLKHHSWYDEKDVLKALQNKGNFYQADLHGLRIPEDTSGLRVQFDRLILSWTRLEKVDLSETHLEGADLRWAHLEEAKLNGAHLEGAFLDEIHLEGAALAGAHLEGAVLTRAHLEEAILHGAHLERAELYDTHLEGAELIEARLEGAKLFGANLGGAQLIDADLSEARLDLANLGRVNLKGAKGLTTGQLVAASTLEGCTLPDGTRLPGREGVEELNDPEPNWRGIFMAWAARGREEGWIYDGTRWGEGYIDVEKFPPRDGEQADS